MGGWIVQNVYMENIMICNIDWKNDEYQTMLRRHECPYYKEGHRMFVEMVNQH